MSKEMEKPKEDHELQTAADDLTAFLKSNPPVMQPAGGIMRCLVEVVSQFGIGIRIVGNGYECIVKHPITPYMIEVR